AVIIGTDCPDLSADLLTNAFSALETHEFVLGPALDGGYYLLGMRVLEESLFQNKTWSTDSVLRDTLEDIRALGKTVHLLPTLSDVDTPADLPAELLNQLTGHQR
ncbi:MAG: glycosyltransferase, partial [Sphingobacteriaceae bacterium]|nr:glycosyltransferase [Cytophagaceae bacterium]